MTPQSDNFEWGNDGDSIVNSGGGITWTKDNGVVQIATAQHYAGSRSMSFVNNAVAANIHFPVTAGTDYSLSCWMLMVSTPAGLTNVIMHGNGTKIIQIYWNKDGKLYYYDSSAHEIGTYSLDAWHLLEVNNLSWTAGTFDIYVDGSIAKAGAAMRTLNTYNNVWHFQQGANDGTKVYIDNIVVAQYPPPTGSTSDFFQLF